jgi:hypothetical protein
MAGFIAGAIGMYLKLCASLVYSGLKVFFDQVKFLTLSLFEKKLTTGNKIAQLTEEFKIFT